MFDRYRIILLLFLHTHAHIQTLTPPPPPRFEYTSVHLERSETGNSFRITAISKGRYVHSEFTDSSPEVSLLNTKRAAG